MRRRICNIGFLLGLTIILFYGASLQQRTKAAEETVIGDALEQLEAMESRTEAKEDTEQIETATETKEDMEQIEAATELDIWKENQAEINLQYLPEMGYHRTIQGKIDLILRESSYACWGDWLIFNNHRGGVYRKENGVYKKVKIGWEWAGNIRQYKNWIITAGSPGFHIFDLDTWEDVDLPYWEDLTEFRGGKWYIFDGKIYYIPYNYQSIHRTDLSNGTDEIVYALDETIYPNHMIYDFAIRDDGDIMAVIRNVEKDSAGEPDYSIESKEGINYIFAYWLISFDADGTQEKKIWETDLYCAMDSIDFNQQGFFQHGYFRDLNTWSEFSEEYGGITWLKENGEIKMICKNAAQFGDFYLAEDGYYREDSIEGPEHMIVSGDYYRDYVDAISKYDFDGNKIGTYRLVDEKILEGEGYLVELIYYEGVVTAFYAMDGTDELYISQIRVE